MAVLKCTDITGLFWSHHLHLPDVYPSMPQLLNSFQHHCPNCSLHISSNPSSPSSSMMHQLCSTQVDTTHLILLSSDFTFNFISLGNLKPSNLKALSITALFDAKCVLNFLCSNVMFCFLTLYGVISEFDNGYALSPMMWNVSSRRLSSM